MRRGPGTRVAYAALGLFGFVLYGSGAITALVRAEADLGYGAGGALASAFPAAAILGAYATSRLLRSGGGGGLELRIIAAAAALIGAGALLLVLPSAWAVGAGLAVMGAAGGSVPPTTAWLLTRLHGEQAARALLEVNVLAALAGMAASATLSGSEALLTWRLAVVLPVAGGVVLARWARRLLPLDLPPAGAAARGAGEGARGVAVAPAAAPATVRIPTAARWYVGVAVCGGAIEFGVVYWSADLLVRTAGMAPAAASGALAAFTAGLVVGRAGLSLVARSQAASRRVLAGSLVVAALGTGGLLVASGAGAGVAALALAGLGTAALYPVSVALAVAVAGPAGARTSALLAVWVGVAALVAPLALAAAAEAAGMEVAFGGVPAAAVVGLLAASAAARAAALGEGGGTRVTG